MLSTAWASLMTLTSCHPRQRTPPSRTRRRVTSVSSRSCSTRYVPVPFQNPLTPITSAYLNTPRLAYSPHQPFRRKHSKGIPFRGHGRVRSIKCTGGVMAIGRRNVLWSTGGPDAEHHRAQDRRLVSRRWHFRTGACGRRGAWLHRQLLLLAAQSLRPQSEADGHR